MNDLKGTNRLIYPYSNQSMFTITIFPLDFSKKQKLHLVLKIPHVHSNLLQRIEEHDFPVKIEWNLQAFFFGINFFVIKFRNLIRFYFTSLSRWLFDSWFVCYYTNLIHSHRCLLCDVLYPLTFILRTASGLLISSKNYLLLALDFYDLNRARCLHAFPTSININTINNIEVYMGDVIALKANFGSECVFFIQTDWFRFFLSAKIRDIEWMNKTNTHNKLIFNRWNEKNEIWT